MQMKTIKYGEIPAVLCTDRFCELTLKITKTEIIVYKIGAEKMALEFPFDIVGYRSNIQTTEIINAENSIETECITNNVLLNSFGAELRIVVYDYSVQTGTIEVIFYNRSAVAVLELNQKTGGKWSSKLEIM